MDKRRAQPPLGSYNSSGISNQRLGRSTGSWAASVSSVSTGVSLKGRKHTKPSTARSPAALRAFTIVQPFEQLSPVLGSRSVGSAQAKSALIKSCPGLEHSSRWHALPRKEQVHSCPCSQRAGWGCSSEGRLHCGLLSYAHLQLSSIRAPSRRTCDADRPSIADAQA